MLKLLLILVLTTAQVEYLHRLTQECIDVLKKHDECSDEGYNTLYYNLSVYSQFDNSFDRYDYIMALRNRCKGKLSKWERGI